jgi:hypothetical protein
MSQLPNINCHLLYIYITEKCEELANIDFLKDIDLSDRIPADINLREYLHGDMIENLIEFQYSNIDENDNIMYSGNKEFQNGFIFNLGNINGRNSYFKINLFDGTSINYDRNDGQFSDAEEKVILDVCYALLHEDCDRTKRVHKYEIIGDSYYTEYYILKENAKYMTVKIFYYEEQDYNVNCLQIKTKIYDNFAEMWNTIPKYFKLRILDDDYDYDSGSCY